MKLIRGRAYARAGLLGNPSDGYNGKTLSLIVRDFSAQAVLYDWKQVEIVITKEDRSRFRSIHDLVHDVQLHGYYGGIRLVKATIKRFQEYCVRRQTQDRTHWLHEGNFSIRYETDIPRQVGLAGSSAIVVATLNALMQFYEVDIPRHVRPSLALSVETNELGISAGLQDRVVQVYGGLVFMDFSHNRMAFEDDMWCGAYEPLDPALLPPLYVAYSTDVGQPTEVLHDNLRARYEQGDPDVIAAMLKFADLAQRGREALLAGQPQRLAPLINENFDLRQSICNLPSAHVQMINTARAVGASAKFAGSGGAIIGTYDGPEMLAELRRQLRKISCEVLVPTVSEPAGACAE